MITICRGLLLVVYLVVGWILGSLVATLALIPVAAITHLDPALRTAVSAVGCVLGIGIAVWRWRARGAVGGLGRARLGAVGQPSGGREQPARP